MPVKGMQPWAIVPWMRTVARIAPYTSVRLPAHSTEVRKALSQYISRPPLSLKKVSVCENGDATVVSYTSDNEFFKGKTEAFSVTRFLLELTQHIPPRGSQYIRRYGLYASRTKGN
jgi:hypothetical protein